MHETATNSPENRVNYGDQAAYCASRSHLAKASAIPGNILFRRVHFHYFSSFNIYYLFMHANGERFTTALSRSRP
ncbi:hypothetical protein [Plasticicumulans acidivorans]|uniref:hypothetical protein n=1 Tax=Plasticicumulans acidivorans TaxID=886464 RepID=UPI0011B476A0|nr:hypothetical protein [Plasticicumulans acidivorans]